MNSFSFSFSSIQDHEDEDESAQMLREIESMNLKFKKQAATINKLHNMMEAIAEKLNINYDEVDDR